MLSYTNHPLKTVLEQSCLPPVIKRYQNISAANTWIIIAITPGACHDWFSQIIVSCSCGKGWDNCGRVFCPDTDSSVVFLRRKWYFVMILAIARILRGSGFMTFVIELVRKVSEQPQLKFQFATPFQFSVFVTFVMNWT